MQQNLWRPKDVGDIANGLILFDGVCVLCSRSMRFVLKRDRDAWFRFTPIQSPYGRALAQRLGIDAAMPQTNAVIVCGRANFKSDTVIAVLERLPRWRFCGRAIALVPRALRDWIYDRVAQNRYRLFGRTESCMVPSPDVLARFIHDDASVAAAVSASRPSPFQFLLGSDFERLPEAVRRAHALSHSLATAGRAEVATAPGLLPRLLCRLAGLPPPGSDMAVTVAFHPDGHLREFWQRRFGERRYASSIRAGDARAPGLLVEHFGLFDLEFRLAPGDGGLAWSLVGWRLCGVRLPRWSAPAIECLESADGERFVFDLDVAFPVIGHVIHYRGWLTP
jgi:predicted DCC family thiol-disulfide oxidoreductase YuxK